MVVNFGQRNPPLLEPAMLQWCYSQTRRGDSFGAAQSASKSIAYQSIVWKFELMAIWE
jgi:hypothetical protein